MICLEGIMKTVSVMRELGVEPSTDTYYKYVFPAIGESLEDIKAALDVGPSILLPFLHFV